MSYTRSMVRRPCVGIPQYVRGSVDRAGWLTWCDYVEKCYLEGVPSQELAEITGASDHNVHQVVARRNLPAHHNRVVSPVPDCLLTGVAKLFADDPNCSVERVRRELAIKSSWSVTKITEQLGIQVAPYRRTTWVGDRPEEFTKNYCRYLRQARYLTGLMVQQYGDHIEGAEFRHLVDKTLPRDVRYELDHKITVYEAFHRSTEPINLYLVIHPANLRYIPATQNREKSSRSVLSPAQLSKEIAAWDARFGTVEYPHYALSDVDAKLVRHTRAFSKVHLPATYSVSLSNLVTLIKQKDRQLSEWVPRQWISRSSVGDILWLFLRGYKPKEIGARFGIGVSQVSIVLTRCGILVDFPKWKGDDHANFISVLNYWLGTPVKNSEYRKYEVYNMRGLSTNIAHDGGPLHYLLRGLVVGKQSLTYLSAQIGVSEVQAFVWIVKSLNLLEYDMTKISIILRSGGVPW